MRLQDLRVYECTVSAEQYEPLASLPALARLSLARCLELPACLGRLPALRLLSLFLSPQLRPADPNINLSDFQAALLDSALSTLSPTQLTQLQLADHDVQWPSTLPRLRGLQVLGLQRQCPSQPLPTGTCLGSLRWAAPLTEEAAATALPALATATRLEAFAVWSHASVDQLQPILPDVIAWAAQ